MTGISLQLTGSANSGFTAGEGAAWTAAPFLRPNLAFAADPMLRLRADLLVSAIFQGATIALAGQQVATFGQPIVIASAGVDFGWF